MKYLLLLLLALAVWWWWRKNLAARRDAEAPPPARPAETMVVCAHCGVHLPATDSLPAGPHHFCCEGHRRAGPR